MAARPKSTRPAKTKPAGAKAKAKPNRKKRSAAAKSPARKLGRLGLFAGAALTALLLTWIFMPGAPPKDQSGSVAQPSRSESAPKSHATQAGPKAPRTGIAFEEPSLPPVDIDRHQRLNEALFDSLRTAGASQEQIVSRLAHNNGDAWWVHSINLSRGQNGRQMAGSIEKYLGRIQAVEVSPGRAGRINTLTVSLDKRKEHVIWLVPPAIKSETPEQPPVLPAPKPGKQKPLAAIVIDDLGYQLKPARQLMDLGLPITFSILPHGPHSKEIAREAKARGMEVFLHLPMEPRSYPRIDPGPGALLVDMPADRLKRLVNENLALVPGATGVNNHMGSRFTESDEKLKPVFEELGKKGLFFLDSYTSPKSRAEKAAREAGLPLVRRDVFLDHEVSEKAITLQMERVLFLAKRKKTVIVIGHPHPETIAVLKSYAPRLGKVLSLVPVSVILAARTGVQKARKTATD